MNIDSKLFREQLAALGKDNLDVDQETDHVVGLARRKEISPLLKDYEYAEIIDSGGSGIVVEVCDSRSGMRRAMKVSRCTAAAPQDADPENPVKVDLEVAAMSLVTHGNITQLYHAATTRDGHYCFISQLVENRRTLDEYLQELIEKRYASLSHFDAVERTVLDLSDKLLQVSGALAYMHGLDLYHMDIKPANLLVDSSGRAYVTDLGFARHKPRYEKEDLVPVGFTFGFEHPRLREGRFRAPTTHAKARNILKAGELSPIFDLYSMGRTILFALRILEQRRGEYTSSSYSFCFLHLIATLLLDGKNISQEVESPVDYFASETALGLRSNLLHQLKLSEFSQLEERLKRLLGIVAMERIVPELDSWYPRSVNHGTGYLNMTPRVSAIVDHPLFQRLKSVKHLGVIDAVYPGATHTRFAHSLGVCDLACRYLLSLLNDRENPLFLAIVTEEDLRIAIVAALIHDVSHSEFGHEMQEMDPTFAHDGLINSMVTLQRHAWPLFEPLISVSDLQTNVSQDLARRIEESLSDLKEGKISFARVLEQHGWTLERLALHVPSIKQRHQEYRSLLDERGRTFLEVIEGCGVDEWALDFTKVLSVLPQNTKRPPVYGVFHEILDGVIDADKLDYLLRDARSCHLPYPSGIDVPRFLRCITVVSRAGEHSKHELRLAIKEKGLASAESITLARQKMYQAVYLQHTSRCTRCMVLTACHAAYTDMLERIPKSFKGVFKYGDLASDPLIRILYARFLLGLSLLPGLEAYHSKKGIKKLENICKKIMKGIGRLGPDIGAYDRSVLFFVGFMDEPSLDLVCRSLRRPIYKRLVEIPLSSIARNQQDQVRNVLSWENRQNLLQKISSKLVNCVQERMRQREILAESLKVPEEFWQTIESKHLLVADMPTRSLGPGGRVPPVLKDISRKRGVFSEELPGSHGHIWGEGMEKMMEEIIACRVYCEPEFYEVLFAFMQQSEIESIVRQEIL